MDEEAKGHVPIRTCVACKKKAPQAELIRVVKQGNRLELDIKRRLGGRGYYLHRDPACISLLADHKKITKAFRVKLPQDMQLELLGRIQEKILGESDGQNAGF